MLGMRQGMPLPSNSNNIMVRIKDTITGTVLHAQNQYLGRYDCNTQVV